MQNNTSDPDINYKKHLRTKASEHYFAQESVSRVLLDFHKELKASYEKTHSTKFSVTPIPENAEEVAARANYHSRHINERLRDFDFLLRTSKVPWETQVTDYCDRLNRIAWTKVCSNCDFAVGRYQAKHPNRCKARVDRFRRRREAKRDRAYWALYLDPDLFIRDPDQFYNLKPHAYHWDWFLHQIVIVH